MDESEKYMDVVLGEKPKEEEPINLNALKKIGKAKKEVDNTIKTFFKFLWDIKLLIIVQLFALVIIGLDKFLTATWSWAIFKDAEFWSSYILYFIANWCVVIGWIIRRFTVQKQSNKKFVLNMERIQAKIDIDYDKPFLEEQAHLEDTMRRAEVFNNKIYKQLYKLSVKRHIRDLNAFYQDNDNYTTELLKSFKGLKKWLKRVELNQAYATVLDLREKLKKDWQKQNLPSQKLKYPRVTRSHITSGLKPSGEFYRFNTYEPKVFSATLKAIAPSSFTFSILGLIILSFQFMEKEALLSDYMLFFSQIFLIFINVILIISSLDSIFDRTYLKSTDERRTDIEKFYRRNENGEDKYTEKEKYAIDIIKYQEKEIGV
jgi:hypothetical protein